MSGKQLAEADQPLREGGWELLNGILRLLPKQYTAPREEAARLDRWAGAGAVWRPLRHLDSGGASPSKRQPREPRPERTGMDPGTNLGEIMKKQGKKLALAKETLRSLGDQRLLQVAGGAEYTRIPGTVSCPVQPPKEPRSTFQICVPF